MPAAWTSSVEWPTVTSTSVKKDWARASARGRGDGEQRRGDGGLHGQRISNGVLEPTVTVPLQLVAARPPRVVGVRAGRHAAHGEDPAFVGGGEVGTVHRHDVGGHVRVDVAVEAVHRRPIERDALGGAGGIETQVEPLAVVEREHVVEDAVVVGQLHRGAHLHGHHAGRELHVALLEHARPRFARRAGRVQPHHHVRRGPAAGPDAPDEDRRRVDLPGPRLPRRPRP